MSKIPNIHLTCVADYEVNPLHGGDPCPAVEGILHNIIDDYHIIYRQQIWSKRISADHCIDENK